MKGLPLRVCYYHIYFMSSILYSGLTRIKK